MRYELTIHWSKEDQAFLVEVPESLSSDCSRRGKVSQST